jgi:hypothetical protein
VQRIYELECCNFIVFALDSADDSISVREKLTGLKLIIEANEARLKLLSEGPSLLAMKSLEERLIKIESLKASRMSS